MSGSIPDTTPSRVAPGPDFREELEGSIVLGLMSLRQDRGGMIQEIRPYSGDFERLQDDAVVDDVKKAIGGKVPAVLVEAKDATFEPLSVGGDRWRAVVEVHLWVCTTSLRERAQRERAPDGAFAILGHLRALLAGRKPAKPASAGQFVLQREESMLHDAQLAIWRQTHIVKVDGVRAFDGKPLTGLTSAGQVPQVSGQGAGLAAAAGVVTLTDPHGAFHRGLLGLEMHIAGATNAANNGGPFPITEIPDTGEGQQIRFANPAGVTEPGFAGTWTIKRTAALITATHVTPT